MNKITQETAIAFRTATPFKKQNREVEVLPNVTILKLHNNPIAYRYNDPKKTLSITNCGWESKLTKETLNAIEGVNINQKTFEWFLNGKKWDGELTDIK